MKRFGLWVSLFGIVLMGCSKNNDVTGNSSVVTVTTAGTLASLLGSSLKTRKILIVKGPIDARDFVTIRDSMAALTTLDLSADTIVGYRGSLGTEGAKNTIYPANTIPPFAFYNAATQTNKTSLSTVSLPAKITDIGDSAFMNCTGITTLIIPSKVVSLDAGAFSGCSGLADITIPSSVVFIGSYAFYHCSGLTTIEVNATTPIDLSQSISVFDGVETSSCVLYVPVGTKSTYQAATGWSVFSYISELGGGQAV
jgi:hypothetical protein